MRSKAGTLTLGLVSLSEEETRAGSPRERTQRGGGREGAPHQEQPCWHPDLRLGASAIVRHVCGLSSQACAVPLGPPRQPPMAANMAMIRARVLFPFFLFLDFRARKGKRETLICCPLIDAFIHWLIRVCALTRDRTHNLGTIGMMP